MVSVFVLHIEPYKNIPTETLLQRLPSGVGTRKFENMTNPGSRLRSFMGEWLARYALATVFSLPFAEIRFSVSATGKPFLTSHPGLFFNISHSGNYVVCATAQNEVGIDVERIRRANYLIAERYFSPAEQQDLFALPLDEQQDYFFTLWTIKESYLKATGQGLALSLDTFTVQKSETAFRLSGHPQAEKFQVRLYPIATDYKLAVCSLDPDFPADFRIIRWEDQIPLS